MAMGRISTSNSPSKASTRSPQPDVLNGAFGWADQDPSSDLGETGRDPRLLREPLPRFDGTALIAGTLSKEENKLNGNMMYSSPTLGLNRGSMDTAPDYGAHRQSAMSVSMYQPSIFHD